MAFKQLIYFRNLWKTDLKAKYTNQNNWLAILYSDPRCNIPKVENFWDFSFDMNFCLIITINNLLYRKTGYI